MKKKKLRKANYDLLTKVFSISSSSLIFVVVKLKHIYENIKYIFEGTYMFII